MKAIPKRPLRIALISMAAIVLVYLCAIFLMRDRSREWCWRSFGDYQPIKECSSSWGGWDSYRCKPTGDSLCVGGMFDPKKGRMTRLDAKRKAEHPFDPNDPSNFIMRPE